MSWRTFGQAVLLILIYLVGYWTLLSFRDAAAARQYREREAAFNVAAAPSANLTDEQLMGNDVATVDATNVGAVNRTYQFNNTDYDN